MDGIFDEAFDCKIPTEGSHREQAAGDFPVPIFVVLNWIAIDGLILPAVNR
jgi:hypothetical protein